MTGIVTRRGLILGGFALWGCPQTDRSFAAEDSYPARPVRLLVGGAAGSVPDTVARLIAERLAAALRQPVVVDDRPGASGVLAMQALVGSAADGHTIALATISQAVFNSYLFSRLSYDPLRDLEPVSPLVAGPMVIVAQPAFPANSFDAFVARAKAEPSKILFGTTQLGSPPDVFARFLMRYAGADVVFVPFKSGLDGMNGILRGDVQLFVDSPLILREQIKAGNLKALAVTGHTCERDLPDVPTLAQSGFSAVPGEPWIGLVAPARTPRDVVDRLNREVTATLQMADLRDRLERLSLVPLTGSPAQFRTLIRDEHARWGAAIREAGLKLD
jgi:tripartite-type tricarboxylate transporter receptor subunit TctC